MSTNNSSDFCQHIYDADDSYTPSQNPNAPAFNLVNFIAVAQKLKLGFLRVTWQAARQQIGSGASGQINQALINLHTSFAFKCVSEKQKMKNREEEIFRSLISEVTALAHPSIRRHPMVTKLEGVCWDIDINEQGGDKIWPVLVFEKSECGDLDYFMQQPAGRNLKFDDRLKLCMDFGWALSDMHMHGIVHGDIKPLNALVFKGTDRYTAKAIDFGFSTRFASKDDPVAVAFSRPWFAPEWRTGFFSAAQAQQMDLFSYGMLCVWVLFERYLSGIAPLPSKARWAEKYFESTGQGSLSIKVLEELKSQGQLTRLAKLLVNEETDADQEDKEVFSRFFDEALSPNPDERTHALEPFPYGKLRNAKPLERERLEEHNFQVSQCKFELASSISQFYASDFRVRRRVRQLLEQQQLAVPDPHTAFQLAVCNSIGFGAPRKEQSLAKALRQSDKARKELEDCWAKMIPYQNEEKQLPGKRYLELFLSGHIPIASPPSNYGGKAHEAEIEIRRELQDLKDCLGESSRLWMIDAFQLSQIYVNMGRWKDAKEVEEKLMEISTPLLDDAHPDMLNIRSNLAKSYKRLGRWKEAQELQLKLLEVRKNVFGKDHVRILDSMDELASTYFQSGQWKKAEELQVRSMVERKRVLGEEHGKTLRIMHNLALTYHQQGLWEKSSELQARTVEISKKVFGVKDHSTLEYKNSLPVTYSQRGNWKEAQELQEQVIEFRKSIFGERHTNTLESMGDLAALLGRQGEFVKAEQISREILTLTEDPLRQDPSTWKILCNLAEILSRQGRYAEAEEINREVLMLQTRILGKEHPETLVVMHNLAGTLKYQGQYAEAESLLQEALVLNRDIMGKEHARTLMVMNNLASVLNGQGKFAEAEKMHEETLALRRKVLGAEHMDTLISMNNLSMEYREQGKYDQAEQVAKEGLLLRQKTLGVNHVSVLTSMNNLAKIYINQGKHAKAQKMLEETVRRKVESSGERHPGTLVVKNNLAESLSGQGKWIEAQKMHQEILAARLLSLGEKHPATLLSTVNLAKTLSGQGKHEEALLQYEQAYTSYRETLGPDHPETQSCLKHCADSRRKVDEEPSQHRAQ